MFKLNILDKTAILLTCIGSINWAVIGLFKFDVVRAIFSFSPLVQRIVYLIIGFSAIYVSLLIIREKTNLSKNN